MASTSSQGVHSGSNGGPRRPKDRATNKGDVGLIPNRQASFGPTVPITDIPFSRLVEHSPDRVTITDRNGVIQFVNTSFERVTGYARDEVLGSTPAVLKSGLHDEKFYRDLWETILSGRPFRAEMVNRKKNGDLYYEDQLITPIRHDGGEITHFMSVARDITHQKKLERELQFRADHDELTGLLNHRSFERLVEERLTASPGRSAALIQVHVGDMETINGALGYDVGDAILREMAARVKGAVGRDDLVARSGGNKFAVMTWAVESRDDALELAHGLRRTLMEPALIDGVSIPLRLDIRAAVGFYPCTAAEFGPLLKAVINSLSRARREGVSVVYSRPDELVSAYERLSVLSDFERALTSDELTLHFQPILNLKTQKVDRFEALIRWNHPEKGLLYPSSFIPILEGTDAMVRLDCWVVKNAVRALQQELRDRPEIRVAVNVSSRSFYHPRLLECLRAIKRADPGACKRLMIEITERTLVDFPQAGPTLNQIKESGVEIAVDDFGTGYSCLAYLEQLPLDVLKIDRSFVSGLTQRDTSAAITRAIISLARNLDLEVYAEGVETRAQLNRLKEEGCDYVQGHFIGRPAPIEIVPRLLEEAWNPFVDEGYRLSDEGGRLSGG